MEHASVKAVSYTHLKAQLGMELDNKKMQLPEPIRTFGVTEVAIKLQPKVVGKFNAHVVEE